ncbi:hypothetical protein [uncultured Tenacibaculum sp.]|uniref:hypothetical protein n=1 Tax=uncultured Tenacibaculum sp. TaxID=174713 RepID=UPI002617390B|nr:hypothetical protein [uncultured Tenacibaculum sp.]
MRFLNNITKLFVLTLLVSCNAQQTKGPNPKEELVTQTNNSPNSLPGATVMSFGPENVLFVGDSKSGMLYAIPTTAKELKEPTAFNLKGIERKIAKLLGVIPSDLIFNDMQIHPVSQEAYIAVKRGFSPDAETVIVAINPTGDSLKLVDVSNRTSIKIKNTRTDEFELYGRSSVRLNITDIDYHDGFVYVAGLTNGEFASNLRKIAYPFNNSQEAVSGIEIYHAVHTQKETRAPIRTMAFEEINGESTLIAAYTCTPLVSIPTSEIKKGNHIKGKTVAELGYGNTPIDMITFTAQEMDGSFDKKLLIIHKERSASLISLKDFAEANKGEGMTSGFSMGPEGVKIFPVPMSGTMHVSEQNQMMITALQRDMDTGQVNLLSELKGAYFRLSNFDSEYEFPDFKYGEKDPWKSFHNMLKPIEGFPELVKEK